MSGAGIFAVRQEKRRGSLVCLRSESGRRLRYGPKPSRPRQGRKPTRMKIRAAVLRQSGLPHPYVETKPLSIETVDLAPPGPGEVLVRIAAAGICHSDLSVVEGLRPRPLPMVIGHESAGIVEAVGPLVEDLRPGDHVVSVFVPMCGHCLPCAEGRPALCEPGGRANVNGTLLSGARRLELRKRAAQPPDRRVLLRRACRDVPPFADQGGTGPASGGGGLVRLRRAHRRGRGVQQRPGAAGQHGRGHRPGRCRPGGGDGRGRRRGGPRHRHRHQ